MIDPNFYLSSPSTGFSHGRFRSPLQHHASARFSTEGAADSQRWRPWVILLKGCSNQTAGIVQVLGRRPTEHVDSLAIPASQKPAHTASCVIRYKQRPKRAHEYQPAPADRGRVEMSVADQLV
jgi:hypothetical protein